MFLGIISNITGFSFWGNIRQNHPFGKPPFCQPPKRSKNLHFSNFFGGNGMLSLLHPLNRCENCSENWVLALLRSADCKRGRRKGATSKNVKNRQKVSKSFSTLFDNCRAGQKTSKIVKKCQKVFRHFSTLFARHLFSGPFCNPLITSWVQCRVALRMSQTSKSCSLNGLFTPRAFCSSKLGMTVGFL